MTIISSHKRTRLKSLAAVFLVKGLIVMLIASCYMYNALTQSENFLWPNNNIIPNAVAGGEPEVKACVRKVKENQCQLHPCKERNGVVGDVSPTPYFGYAGRFVHRYGNLTKPLPFTLGDTGWASGCILSDKYKFVFIHVLKSGGTAVKKFLKDSLCGPADSECERVPETLIRAEGCIKSIRDHQDYFHFSFVRNPFSRMYSAYSMMDGFPPSNGVRGRLPTKDFSFSDFVLKPNQRDLHTSMWPGHYDRQREFLFSEDGQCPVFDFLGRLEHLDEDMQRILNHLNATTMLDYLDSIGGKIIPANSWGADKKKSVGGGLRKEYAPPVIGRVASLYYEDFQLLGYDFNEIPQK
mmetsp:Transcript_31284/g.75625  ORF Transcript_31284/g.75625 Transcript_31284/m.75625 type:complete len:352 (+) Transcript_31284:233-1288(+)